MRLALVALAAKGDVVLGCRAVTGMAILAADRGLVFTAIHFDVRSLRFMAFKAVA